MRGEADFLQLRPHLATRSSRALRSLETDGFDERINRGGKKPRARRVAEKRETFRRRASSAVDVDVSTQNFGKVSRPVDRPANLATPW